LSISTRNETISPVRAVETPLEHTVVRQVHIVVVVGVGLLAAGLPRRPVRPVETTLEESEIAQVDVAVVVEIVGDEPAARQVALDTAGHAQRACGTHPAIGP